MTIVAILVTIVIIYAIFNSVLESRENKMSEELTDLIYEEFLEEARYFRELLKSQQTALLKIKAIFDHLGIKVEIIEDKITPSIDTFRSISFVKEYLPEIDEQLGVYEDAEKEMNRLDTNDKSRYVINSVHEIVSPNKWRKLSKEQKRKMIHDLAEGYAAIMNNDQENLTE